MSESVISDPVNTTTTVSKTAPDFSCIKLMAAADLNVMESLKFGSREIGLGETFAREADWVERWGEDGEANGTAELWERYEIQEDLSESIMSWPHLIRLQTHCFTVSPTYITQINVCSSFHLLKDPTARMRKFRGRFADG